MPAVCRGWCTSVYPAADAAIPQHLMLPPVGSVPPGSFSLPWAAPGQALPRQQATVGAKMAMAALGFRPAPVPGRSARSTGACLAHRLASGRCGPLWPSQHRAVPLTRSLSLPFPLAVSQPLKLRFQPAARPLPAVPPQPAALPPPADGPPPASSGAASRRAAATQGAVSWQSVSWRSVSRQQLRRANRRTIYFLCGVTLLVAGAAFWTGDPHTGCFALVVSMIFCIILLNS